MPWDLGWVSTMLCVESEKITRHTYILQPTMLGCAESLTYVSTATVRLLVTPG